MNADPGRKKSKTANGSVVGRGTDFTHVSLTKKKKKTNIIIVINNRNISLLYDLFIDPPPCSPSFRPSTYNNIRTYERNTYILYNAIALPTCEKYDFNSLLYCDYYY